MTATPANTPISAPISTAAATAQTAKIVTTANAFLATLTDDQKKAVQYAWTDDKQRRNWSNFPTGAFQRTGVSWGDLSETQRTALMTLLGAVLSPSGLEMVKGQMNADDVLRVTGGGVPAGHTQTQPPASAGTPVGTSADPTAGQVSMPGRPATGPVTGAANGSGAAGANSGGSAPASRPTVHFGSNYYFVSFVGQPSTSAPWTLQFGGHHLALNATVVGPNVTLSPSLTGGEPIHVSINGYTFAMVPQAPLEMNVAHAMLSSLTPAQKAKAVISTQLADLVLGPGHDGQTLQPEGLPGSAMTASQKTKFLALIKARLSALNEVDLAPKMAVIEANLNRTYFAWYGPTKAGSAAYFRVVGPTLIVEFAPQATDGTASDHLHNMYRDPTNEYGAAWAK